MSHARERITLLDAQLIRNIFVATGERNWLEGDGLDFIDVFRCKINNRPDTVVVDCVDDGRHQGNLDPDAGEVFNRLLLYVKQIADAAMLVLLFADAVKLKIHTVLPRSLGCLTKLNVLGETYAVGGRKNSVEANLLSVSDDFELVGRKSWFTTGKENNDLALWLKRNCAIQNCFGIFKRRLVNIANLIRVHEAGIAHHVAAIGEVDSQNSAATKLDVRCAVMMDVGIFGGFK